MRTSQSINQSQGQSQIRQSFVQSRGQNPQYVHSYHIPQPTVSTHRNFFDGNLNPNQTAPHHVSSVPKQYRTAVIKSQRTAEFGATQSSGAYGQKGQYFKKQSYQRNPEQVQTDYHRVITQPVHRTQYIQQNSFNQRKGHVASHAVTQSELQGSRQRRNLTPEIQRMLNKPVYAPAQNGGTIIKTMTGDTRVINSSYANTGYVQSRYNRNFEEYKVPNPTRHQIINELNRDSERIIHMDSRVQGQEQAPTRKVVKVDHVPYMRRYYQWEQREVVNVVYVPVQRYIEDFYTVEHFVEYEPVAREQTVIQYLPQERINYRVQYQMVQKKIVHIPTEQGTELKDFREEDRMALIGRNGIQVVAREESRRQQTHYVTSQVPSYKVEIEPQFIIEQRQSRFRDVREEQVNYNQQQVHQASNQGSKVLIQNQQANTRQISRQEIRQEDNFIISNDQQSKFSRKSNKINPFNNLDNNQQNREPGFVLQ